MKSVKRAIALSGGGPPVGLEVGALKALDEHDIEFDVFSTDCIGSWTACIYNSNEKGKRFEKMKDFYKICFVPDDVFDGFSIPIEIFIADYFEEWSNIFEKLLDQNTYKNLLIPQQIAALWMHYFNPVNFPKNTTDLSLLWTKMMSLNPYCRLLFKLNYKTKSSGRSWLLGPGDYSKEVVAQYIDFDKLKTINPWIYVNAYNLTKKNIELFVNRDNHPRYKPIDLDVLKANSSILGYLKNRTVGSDRYCEGAVADTVNFKHLLENHPDLDEVWVVNILDYKEIRPPKNQLEADLLAVELPFTTIAQDDIKLFCYHLKDRGLEKKINVIKIRVSYREMDFFWRRSTLERGIETGYKGAKETLKKYLAKKSAAGKGKK